MAKSYLWWGKNQNSGCLCGILTRMGYGNSTMMVCFKSYRGLGCEGLCMVKQNIPVNGELERIGM